ncbi:hypothetical protein ACWGQ4_11620 [Streptomyces sp. NPDC055721]|uniref:hypothetical protein n=1 Tax=Streptomyces sp. NPDC127132 TaxID=3345374 RepID=UPI003644FEE8
MSGNRTTGWRHARPSGVIDCPLGLAADQGEADALTVYAEACETTVVHYTPAS